MLLKEKIDSFSALTLADPYDARSIQVANDGSVFVAFAIGNLIHPDGSQCSDPMPIPQSGDALVEEIREGGGGDVKEPGGGLLSHQLAVHEQGILEAIGNPGVGICPRDPFLSTAMTGAHNLFGGIPE